MIVGAVGTAGDRDQANGQNHMPLKWRAGAAKRDITPDYPVRLSGFGFRRSESEGVQHPIHARALAMVFSDGQPFVMVTVDTCGVSTKLRNDVLARLDKYSIASERFALLATHTHTAPMIDGVLPTLFGEPISAPHHERIVRYTRELTDCIVQVVGEALGNMVPARISLFNGEVGFAINRRTTGGPVDHDLPVLVIRNAEDRIIAVHASYACHCVTLSNNLIGGDWAGFAAEFVERLNPGSVGLISIGCGADQNPDTGVTGDRIEAARCQGAAIADEIKRLLSGEGRSIDGQLRGQWERLSLALDTPRTEDQWRDRVGQGGAIGYHAQRQLDRIAAGQQLTNRIDYPIQTWKFGDQLAMAFLPGEVVVDYSLRLKEKYGRDRVWICAYANDTPCYIPSERILREGGYEGEGAMVYYDLPQRLAPGLEGQIVEAVVRQWQPQFAPRENGHGLAEIWNRVDYPPTAEQILESLEVAEGFRVELVASEPLVVDPVAIAFGIQGELWVCQMSDYPTGMDGQFSPGGSVRRLVDLDGDGKFDRGDTFLEQVPFPTGVLPWRDGVLICAAPDILWARDTTGDGRADQVQKLFSGFATHNYHARVNSLRYGLDGWVYGSGGLFGGVIQSFVGGDAVDVTGRDFRIQPDTGRIEPVSGQTQQGRSRNDWGDWFGCDNSMLVRHYPLVDHYYQRNVYVIPPPAFVAVSYAPDPGQVFGISQATRLPLSGPANRVTAACGLTVYRDDWFGGEWRGDLFVCESVGNLVTHLRLQESGVTFRGHRLPELSNQEFLASRSPWFRPVEAISGPDGALWIVDMCRWVIEHPQWVPAEILNTLNVRAGENAGRIFRVVRDGRTGRKWSNLVDASAAELVNTIGSPNGYLRDLAMQMLVWREERSAAPLLRDLFDRALPLVQIQVLAALDGLGCLQESDVVNGLRSTDRELRRHAIRLAEQFPSLHPLAADLTDSMLHRGGRLEQQWLWSLGEFPPGIAASALAKGVQHDVVNDNEYLISAAQSSLTSETAIAVVEKILDQGPQTFINSPSLADWIALASSLSPEDGPELAARFVIMNDSAVDPLERCGWLAASWDRFQTPVDVQSRTLDRLTTVRRAAETVLHDERQSDQRRVVAIRLLARSALTATEQESLISLLQPHFSLELQRAAMDALGRVELTSDHLNIFAHWTAMTPTTREIILSNLFARPSGVKLVMQGIQTNRLSVRDLDPARRQQLLLFPDETIRDAARQVLASPTEPNSAEYGSLLASVLSFTGRGSNGRDVFRRSCSACHVLEGFGHAVGPDLAGLANRSPSVLLESIAVPDRNVDARYQQYLAVLRDGRVFMGMMADESAGSFSLVAANNERHSIRRNQIDQLRSTNKSLMPEELANDLSHQELADLLAYLQQTRQPRKQTVGNQPQVISLGTSPNYELLASQASIYGQDIDFEVGPDAIGFWHGESDHVEWVVDVTRPGEYVVLLEWSCAPYSAGNLVAIELGRQQLEFTAESTGAWHQFSRREVGTLQLMPGKQSLVVRPAGPLTKPALLDLKRIELIPR
jgi:putative membrane-bound dehydrogenase-like protein